ncbi:MAG: GNAT family N-acetyltransferase [Hyphomicrobiaceae bacterium]|nr:GNAT family N-acetyltransferase [Hyphomicrobiaceae bacterium]
MGIGVLTWLAQSQSAYNMGLYRKDIANSLDGALLQETLAVVRSAVPGVHAGWFLGQPERWGGNENPFIRVGRAPRGSCFEVPLSGPFERVVGKQLSSDKRQDLRRQQRRVSEQCDLAVGLPFDRETRELMVETSIAQKTRQIEEAGLPNLIDHPALIAFHRQLARDEMEGVRLEIGYLDAGGHVLSTLSGIRYKDRFYHINGSIAETPLRRWSLAQLLIHDLMARQCQLGAAHWDFGPGEGSHKALWHPDEIPMFDTFVAFDAVGRALMAIDGLMIRSRRWIAARPALRKVAHHIRSTYLRSMRKLPRAR